jgi:hypothetical protein
MTDRSTGPRCGNNPNARLTDGDRKAVADFKEYLANRAAVERVRAVLETEAVVGRSALEYRGLIASALMAAEPAAAGPDQTADTLPAWLYQRFMQDGEGWNNLDDNQRTYWEHQARAVRRAVERGGFKAAATDGDEGRIVAYRGPGSGWLFCRNCADGSGMQAALTSDDLPDGGLCDECGVDVLIPQQPQEARP